MSSWICQLVKSADLYSPQQVYEIECNCCAVLHWKLMTINQPSFTARQLDHGNLAENQPKEKFPGTCNG